MTSIAMRKSVTSWEMKISLKRYGIVACSHILETRRTRLRTRFCRNPHTKLKISGGNMVKESCTGCLFEVSMASVDVLGPLFRLLEELKYLITLCVGQVIQGSYFKKL